MIATHPSPWLFAALFTILGFAAFGGTAMATSSVEEEERIRTVVEHAFKAWSEGTGGPFDLLADDASWIVTGNSKVAKTYSSKESFVSEVIRPFNARMRERLVPTKVHELVVDGERVVVRFDAAGTAIDGKPYANTYAWFLTVRDDKIVNVVAFFDSIAFDDLWTRVTPALP
jgi:ketosteroid isomerase-like protein